MRRRVRAYAVGGRDPRHYRRAAVHVLQLQLLREMRLERLRLELRPCSYDFLATPTLTVSPAGGSVKL